jgi:hypothetical protein
MENYNILDKDYLQSLLQEAFSPETEEYRRNIDAQWKVLRGNLMNFVEGELQRIYPKTHGCFTKTDINLAKKITHKRAQAYKKTPIRLLGNDNETKFYQDLMTDVDAQRVFRTHDTYYNYFKYSCIWLNYFMENGDQKLIMRALRPNQFMRVVDSKGRTQVFLVFMGETDSSAVKTEGDGRSDRFQGPSEDRKCRNVAIWSEKNHVFVKVETGKDCNFEYIPMEGNELSLNTFGAIPAIFSQEGDQQDRPALNNLASQTVTANVMLSTILSGMSAQSFGQLVVKYPEGQTMPDVISQGMFTFLKLPQAGEGQPETTADYISPKPDLSSSLEVFRGYIAAMLDEHQINAGVVAGNVEKFTSGLDRLLSQADTNEVIESNQEEFAKCEKSLFELIKTFYELKSSYKITSKQLMIKYIKPTPSMGEKEILDNAKLKMDLGIIERYEILQALDPNLEDEQAEERIDEIDENKAEKAKGFSDAISNKNSSMISNANSAIAEMEDERKAKIESAKKAFIQ